MSSKNKKKKRNSLLILFVCIIVCAGGYALLSIYDTRKEKAEEDAAKEEEITLLSIEEGTVSNLEFHNSFGSMELLKNGEEWICKEEKKFPLNQEYVNTMEETVTNFTALRQITEKAEDMAEYGLENPEIEAVFTTSDGKNTIYLGDKSPSSDSGYYCRFNDEKAVYEVDSSVFTAFNYSREQMMTLEDSPEIISSQVTKLDVKNPKEFDFIAVNETMGDHSSWTVKAPYDTFVVGNESNLTTFFENYESLSYEGAKEYNCKDFSQYGLEEKNPETALIYVDYYELVEVESDSDSNEEDSEEVSQERVDHQAKFIIGSRDEDGSYYVRVNDSSYVYLMDEDDVDNMIPDSSYLYVEPTISRISAENINKSTFMTTKEEYQIVRKSKIVKNDDGEEETETDYFFNNKSMEPVDFNTMITSWTALKTSKEITAKEKKEIDKEKVILTVKIEGTTGDQTVEFFYFDKSYYAIKEEESILFLADKRDVDGFIAALEEQADQ